MAVSRIEPESRPKLSYTVLTKHWHHTCLQHKLFWVYTHYCRACFVGWRLSTNEMLWRMLSWNWFVTAWIAHFRSKSPLKAKIKVEVETSRSILGKSRQMLLRDLTRRWLDKTTSRLLVDKIQRWKSGPHIGFSWKVWERECTWHLLF